MLMVACMIVVSFLGVNLDDYWPNKNISLPINTSYYALPRQKMANGEFFDKHNKKLAAHPRLPFGTEVEVINPINNKKLVVEITDRGPNIRGRGLDLSEAAAKYLEFEEDGVTILLAKVVSRESSLK